MAALSAVTNSLTNVGTSLQSASPFDFSKAPGSAKDAARDVLPPMGDSIPIVFSSMTMTVLLWDLPDRDSSLATAGDLLLRGGVGLVIGALVARAWAFSGLARRVMP